MTSTFLQQRPSAGLGFGGPKQPQAKQPLRKKRSHDSPQIGEHHKIILNEKQRNAEINQDNPFQWTLGCD